MYHPYSRRALLLKALIAGAVGVSWPGMLAIPMALMWMSPFGLVVPIITFLIAFLFGTALGLPAYLVLRARGRANAPIATLWGAFVGMAFAVTMLLHEWRGGGFLEQAWGALCVFAGLSAIGGGAFYAVASNDPGPGA